MDMRIDANCRNIEGLTQYEIGRFDPYTMQRKKLIFTIWHLPAKTINQIITH
mgnify:CR=1 FL=1